MNNPEYVRCVLTGVGCPARDGTWCGRAPGLGEWTFEDGTHAILEVQRDGRLRICRNCAQVMIKIIEKGTYSPSEE